jgi:hypothetical protein
MTQSLYAYAEVGREGLGQMLLPWARCEVFRQQWNVPVLAPRWSVPMRWLRRGRRAVPGGGGMFQTRGYVRGASRLRVLMTAKRVGEREFVPGSHDAERGGRKTLVVFSGEGNGLTPLLPHRELIRRRLTEMLSRRVQRQVGQQRRDFVIGVHLRRNEKGPVPLDDLWLDQDRVAPDAWYVRSIQSLRKVLGYAAPVRVFSDAWPGDLRALLAMPNVSAAPASLAVADMLMLARSRILLAGGSSMISQWASYLGETPTVWYPGCAPGLNPDKPGFETETDAEGHVGREFAGVIETLNLQLNP